MMRQLLSCLALIILFFPPAAPSRGQSAPGNHVAAELKTTDEVLEQAREILPAVSPVPVKVSYESAVNLQAQAHEEYRLGPDPGRWEKALLLTIQARAKAQEAIAQSASLGGPTTPDETALQRRLERADELMAQAREALEPSADNSLQALYESARSKLDRAHGLCGERQYRAALKLAGQVERTAERVLQAATRAARDDFNYDRCRENVRRYFEQAGEQIAECESPSALLPMEQARQAMDMSEKQASEGDRAGALHALQTARELAAQALRECTGNDNLHHRHKTLRQQADRLGEAIGAENTDAFAFLAQARTQLDLAQAALEQGDRQAVVAALKAAQLSLDEARRKTLAGRRTVGG
ncbi:MAG TPA: hypothetical protein PK186_10680 [candidate division Zixibacteria bacterium]|nr:hypothetical protein [candidate division Zixibacteria bacterium]MDD4916769.1 hypothetical protein [candidate division Zixibacteria bacterium]MDM7973790.1 hypothetical protein [candidate division Zixibacteria bacterium]HOD67682.1 hypothetical protein [candidate division Zixibacteria bacterium]HPC11066.1 hypothetical protein [candidate division Zixibacteria bacterium]